MTQVNYPIIRPLEFHPFEHEGDLLYIVRDPERVNEKQVVMPAVLAQMTTYCDGQHDVPMMYDLLEKDVGYRLPEGTIETALEQLDEAYLLNNHRYRRRLFQMANEYREQPFRPMMLADLAYPRDVQELKAKFDEYGADDDAVEVEHWRGRAVVSPHIDYQRGGPVYAKTWKRAQSGLHDIDLVLMFATDHNGGLGSLTLTDKPYETPYGVLPTDPELLQKLADAIGEDQAYKYELNHRQEHSVELSAVWLHHALPDPDNPPPMVPLLIGSFAHFVQQQSHPDQDRAMVALIETLVRETAGKNVMCVASVDMSHVGPAFGDSYIMDVEQRERVESQDKSLIEAMIAGDAERWYKEIADIGDMNKVCGYSPVYLMLRYLNAHQQASATLIDYAHCPADEEDHSLVSISGLLVD